jgi:hypothetical protein
MTRWAFKSPLNLKQNLLLAIAMGSAAAMLGCGGGGGSSTPPVVGDCGSLSGSGTVVCGFVTNDGTGSGVNGVTVRLRNAAGATLASGVTATDASSGSPGFYKITMPAGAAVPATVSVDTPATGFHQNLFRYNGIVWSPTTNATAGGPCVPLITVTAGADTRLTQQLRLFSDSTPPPPFFGCSR